MGHVILHAFIDSLKVLGIAVIFNIILSFFEGKISKILGKNSRVSPLIGSAAGLIPQCGVSVVAADMYIKEHITAGTLLAIFFACSDEALPLLFTEPSKVIYVFPMLLIKIVFGFILGVIVDFIIRKKEIKEFENEVHVGCCHHHIDDDEENKFHKHLLHPFLHSLKIFIYVFVINLIFGMIVHFVGEDVISSFLSTNQYLAVFLSGLIGIIPNCSSSVIITELFLTGGLNFGALIAGLCVNAGLGFTYLLKNKESRKSCLKMLCILFTYSIVVGYITLFIINLF